MMIAKKMNPTNTKNKFLASALFFLSTFISFSTGATVYLTNAVSVFPNTTNVTQNYLVVLKEDDFYEGTDVAQPYYIPTGETVGQIATRVVGLVTSLSTTNRVNTVYEENTKAFSATFTPAAVESLRQRNLPAIRFIKASSADNLTTLGMSSNATARNRALYGTVSQSSTQGGGVPEHAIDGRNNAKAATTQTQSQAQPWWQERLNDVTLINSISFFNYGNSTATSGATTATASGAGTTLDYSLSGYAVTYRDRYKASKGAPLRTHAAGVADNGVTRIEQPIDGLPPRNSAGRYQLGVRYNVDGDSEAPWRDTQEWISNDSNQPAPVDTININIDKSWEQFYRNTRIISSSGKIAYPKIATVRGMAFTLDIHASPEDTINLNLPAGWKAKTTDRALDSYPGQGSDGSGLDFVYIYGEDGFMRGYINLNGGAVGTGVGTKAHAGGYYGTLNTNVGVVENDSLLKDVYVFISNQPFGNRTLAELKADPTVQHQYFPGIRPEESTWTLNAQEGQYVRVQMAGTGSLVLSEVKVIGYKKNLPISTNRALQGTASQSSTAAGGIPGRAIDGNNNGYFAQGSTTHTNHESQPWWQVDLGADTKVEGIRIANRRDSCCRDRLKDAYVFISKQPFGNRTLAQINADPAVHKHFLAGVSPSKSTWVSPTPLEGRYVRVQLAGTGVLSLAEVKVIGYVESAGGPLPPPEPTEPNVATDGTASQSSTAAGGIPGRAIDGNTDGNYRVGSTTHTQLENQPWWQVDLDANTAIEQIRWYNRTDCCSDRLKDLNVFVSDTPFGARTLAELKAEALTNPNLNHEFFADVQPDIGHWTQAQEGQYIRLQLEGTGVLSLAEVRVHGVKDSTPPLEPTEPNVATDGTANQSSTGYGGVPKRAIDGNTDGDYRVGSTTHTNYESQPWWQVDLGADTAIEMIRWYNRTNCCSDRLKDLNVFVSDTPFGAKTLAELKAEALTNPNLNHEFFADVQPDIGQWTQAQQGRYVRLQLEGTGYLSLAEVRVHGVKDSTPPPTPTEPNVAPNGAAEQSSDADGVGTADKAIDENENGFYANGSTTQTQAEAQPWWQVDLGANTTIETIHWHNRMDECCSDRLKDLNVFVSDTPFGAKTLAELKADPNVSHEFFAGVQPDIGHWTQTQQGRYVRLQLEGTDNLSLAEVKVHGVKDTPEPPPATTKPNVAPDGTANQSSNADGVGTADKAIDDNTDSDYANGSTTQTQADAQAWWQVDLGAKKDIEAIHWYNRTDCCAARLKDLNVFVSDTPFGAKTLAELKADPNVSHQFFADVQPNIGHWTQAQQGQYVRLQLEGTDNLSLAEVKVFGEDPSPTLTQPNIAPDGVANQSSTAAGGLPSRAIDANTDGNFANGSTTQTQAEAQPWWDVDLNGTAQIEAIRFFNRTDCCADNLRDVNVFVSDTPFDTRTLAEIKADPAIHKTFFAGVQGTMTEWLGSSVATPGGLGGRYVRIQLDGADTTLSLAEVQVFGELGDEPQ